MKKSFGLFILLVPLLIVVAFVSNCFKISELAKKADTSLDRVNKTTFVQDNASIENLVMNDDVEVFSSCDGEVVLASFSEDSRKFTVVIKPKERTVKKNAISNLVEYARLVEIRVKPKNMIRKGDVIGLR